MPNPTFDLDWLDAQCELFELKWSADRSGPDAVVEFALDLLQSTDVRLKPLLELLIEIDMERVWMDWRTKVFNQSQDYSPSEWIGQLALVPRIEDYVAAIASRNVEFSVTESLVRTEYRARQEWGDAPRWDIAVSPWPIMPKLPAKPARHQVEFQSKEFPIPRVFDLCGLTEFGRQRTTDDQSGVLVHDGHTTRVIVANRADATISRRLFSLQILSAQHAVIANLSQTNPLPISPTTVLESGAASVVQLPFAFCVQKLRLRFA
ncbi:MAG: hypothetical protein ABL921_02060 [Pirellula sp.]